MFSVLGNVRAVISNLNNDKKLDINTSTTTNEIINVNSYYPFGMVMVGTYANNTTTPDTKYQYNGKEMNSDLGLNFLDYGARWYDPAIGRFTGVDLLSESLENYSGFSYAANNPILLVDFYGLSPLYNWDEHSKGNKGLYNNGGNAVSFDEAINIATKGMKNSAYITQKSSPMSKTGCDKAICAAMDYANDNTAVSFVMADNLNGVSNELERISSTKGKFDNLVFASHGSREHFYVGLQTISDPDLDNEWNSVKNVLKSNSNVTILACNVGFLANGRNPLLEALALKLESRIFGNQSLSYPGSPHSHQYTTNKAIKKEYPKFIYEKINNRWSVFEYSKGQVKISVVRNFFLSEI